METSRFSRRLQEENYLLVVSETSELKDFDDMDEETVFEQHFHKARLSERIVPSDLFISGDEQSLISISYVSLSDTFVVKE